MEEVEKSQERKISKRPTVINVFADNTKISHYYEQLSAVEQRDEGERSQ